MAAALVAAGNAFAQKGKMAVGADLSVNPSVSTPFDSRTNFGIGAKFQYGLTNAIRADIDMDYLFKAGENRQFDAIANIHYLFDIGRGCNMYPLVGVGYARVMADGLPSTISDNKFLFNAGLGIETYSQPHLKFFLEVKYQYVKDWQKVPIQAGVAYVF